MNSQQLRIIREAAQRNFKLDADHLFERNTTQITIRRGHYLRGYAYRFLEECSPVLTSTVVKAVLEAE